MPTADQVVVVLKAETDAYNASINKAEANFSAKIGQMEAEATHAGLALQKIGQSGTKAFTAVNQNAPKATTAIKAVNSELKFLPAQLSDIAVQLAGGQSPFQIMLQQGTQINQALAGQEGLRGVIGSLGGAFASLVNPAGLATFAIIGLGGVAAQYFASLLTNGDKSEESLKRQADLIQKVADRWGDAEPALKAYVDQLKEAQDRTELIAAKNAVADKQYDDVRAAVKGLSGDLGEAADKIERLGGDDAKTGLVILQGRIAELDIKLKNNTATAEDALVIYRGLTNLFQQTKAAGVDAIAQKFKDLSYQIDIASENYNKFQTLFAGNGRSSRGGIVLDTSGNPLRFPQNAPSPDGRPNTEDSSIGQSIDSLTSAIDGFVERVIKAESGGRADAKNPNSSATGVGQFIESTWLDLFRKYYPDAAQTMGRDAILELRKDADVSRVLIEGYAKENAAVLQRAGVTVTEAALQLAHFLGAGDAAKVLNAAPGTPLAGLISASSIKANPTILGGGRTVDDAISYANHRADGAGAGATPKKTPDQIFQGSVDQIQARIDAINAEIEATAGLTRGTDEYSFAVEKSRAEQQLLNDAKKAGLEITPELASKIDQLAGNYAKLTVAQNSAKTGQKDLNKSMVEFNQFSQDILGGFIKDLESGKSAAEALSNALQKVANRLLDVGLEMLFPTQGAQAGGGLGGGLFGILGGLLGFRARGGPVQAGKPYVVGERGPELMIPGGSGTVIPNAAMPSRRDGGGNVAITVHSVRGEMFDTIVEAVSQKVATRVTQQGVAAHDKQINRSFGSRMANAQSRQL